MAAPIAVRSLFFLIQPVQFSKELFFHQGFLASYQKLSYRKDRNGNDCYYGERIQSQSTLFVMLVSTGCLKPSSISRLLNS
jgi:hypothetical protein